MTPAVLHAVMQELIKQVTQHRGQYPCGQLVVQNVLTDMRIITPDIRPADVRVSAGQEPVTHLSDGCLPPSMSPYVFTETGDRQHRGQKETETTYNQGIARIPDRQTGTVGAGDDTHGGKAKLSGVEQGKQPGVL